MPTLISCLSSGKGTWTEVNKIIKAAEWDKVFLVTNQFGKDNFNVSSDKIQLVLVDMYQDTSDLVNAIKKELNGKIDDFEIALNFVSGSGKEHMALLEAVLELGLNFRLVHIKNEKMETMGINP